MKFSMAPSVHQLQYANAKSETLEILRKFIWAVSIWLEDVIIGIVQAWDVALGLRFVAPYPTTSNLVARLYHAGIVWTNPRQSVFSLIFQHSDPEHCLAQRTTGDTLTKLKQAPRCHKATKPPSEHWGHVSSLVAWSLRGLVTCDLFVALLVSCWFTGGYTDRILLGVFWKKQMFFKVKIRSCWRNWYFDCSSWVTMSETGHRFNCRSRLKNEQLPFRENSNLLTIV